MKEITLIGSGNVAYHLCLAFSGLEYKIYLYSKNKISANELHEKFNVELIDSPETIQNQLVLICVNDSNIPSVVELVNDSNKIAYTSGSCELHSLPQKSNLGVFYPLQTFSKERTIDLFDVPFFVEANNSYFAQELFDLAWQLSKKVEFADSKKRKHIHIAAVIANNFTNHLLHLAKNYSEANELDWTILQPLIRETINKAIAIEPENAQTGPAKRNDLSTIQNHLESLNVDPTATGLKTIYTLITNSILETYGHEKL